MAWTKVETEVAAVVVDDLRARGWTVYQEVTVHSAVCDIVASKGRVLWAIECKVALGLPVLAQARRWLACANLVSVAVPKWKPSETMRMAIDTAGMFGIGVLDVAGPDARHCGRHGGRLGSRIYEVQRPELRRTTTRWMRVALHEQQQTHAPAGNSEGKRYTPFSATCDALRDVLRRGPMTVSQAVTALAGRHHYASEASAKSSIYKWADEGLIDGVEVVREGHGSPVRLRLR